MSTATTATTKVYTEISQLAGRLADFYAQTGNGNTPRLAGICGFDGFIDTFIQMQMPRTMAEFGPKVAEAAGVAASYPVRHLGDKFGGNGPLFAVALHDILAGNVDISYIGALGKDSVLTIFREAFAGKIHNLYTLADPAHSDCIEFKDGKVMLSDLSSCAEIGWGRLIECVGAEKMDALLLQSRFIGAVNWGKLTNVGTIWDNVARRLSGLGVSKKKVIFFMDLAEFEQRPRSDRLELLELVGRITGQCHTLLSFNLKEAWQMAGEFGGEFHGKKSPHDVAELTAFLKDSIAADRIVVHPNTGAACASDNGCVYVPGPFCHEPLISIGAGDNFGAGCLAGALCGLDDVGVLLGGVSASGYFVRSGKSASFQQMHALIKLWSAGNLPERL